MKNLSHDAEIGLKFEKMRGPLSPLAICVAAACLGALSVAADSDISRYDAHYDVLELSLSSAYPGCAIVYQVLVAEVVFPNSSAVRLQRSHPENAYQEGAASDILTSAGSHGTLDLRCERGPATTCSWRSDAVPQSLPHLFPRARLVPVEHAASYAVTSFLGNLIFSQARHSPLIRRGNRLRSMLVLKATPTNACLGVFEHEKEETKAAAKGNLRDPLASLRYEDPCFASLLRQKVEKEEEGGGGKCSLHILSEEEQLQRGRKEAVLYFLQRPYGQKQYFANAGDSGSSSGSSTMTTMQPLTGSFPLRRVRDAYSPPSSSSPSSSSSQHHTSVEKQSVVVEKARTMEALRVGRSILRSAFPQLYGQSQSSSYQVFDDEEAGAQDEEGNENEAISEEAGASQQGGEEDDDLLSSPAFLELGAEARSAIEAAALSAAAATAEAGLPGLSGMLSPILDGLLKPVTGVIGGVMSDMMGDSLQNVLGGTVESGLTSEITALLTHSLTSSLTESLVPPLTESLTDSITNTLTPQLRDAISPPIAEQLAASVSASVSQSLSRSLSERLLEDVPTGLSQLLTPELTYFLTQSVTQAVVPALTYTLHHSPAEDFYCAYCKEFKVYCEWCREASTGAEKKSDGTAGGNNSPSDQLYRSHYYAAYFSKYYAQQAARQFKEQLKYREGGGAVDGGGMGAPPSPPAAPAPSGGGGAPPSKL